MKTGSKARIVDPFEYTGEVVTIVAPYDYPGVESTTVEFDNGFQATILDLHLAPLSDRECLDLAIETEAFGGLCPNGETVEQALRQLLGRSDVTAVAEAFKAYTSDWTDGRKAAALSNMRFLCDGNQ